MLRIGATQRYYDPLAVGINDVQELSKTHEAISKAKTEIQHRILTHYLPLYFPEADRFHGSSRSDWFFAFLEAFSGVRDRAVKGRVYQSGVEPRRTEGQQGTPARRYYETERSSIDLPLPSDAPAIEMFPWC
jgi:hypothetical protein